MIAKGQQLGVNEIGWHCWRNNEPSKATAKSLGFELVREERVLFAYTDALENLAVNGYISLRDGSAEQSLQWFEKAMQVGELPAWALPYWEKARSILAVRR